MTEPNFEMLHGRTNKKLITLPESWEEDVDMSTVTVHLTQVGANQDLRVKRHQGRGPPGHEWTPCRLLLPYYGRTA